MKILEYKGTSHYREVSAADLERLGLDETRPIQVARRDLPIANNGFGWEYTVELTNETAEWLLAYEKGEWVEVEPDEVPTLAQRMIDEARSDHILPLGSTDASTDEEE